MDHQRATELAAHLEATAKRLPWRHTLTVFAVACLGFGIVALVLGMALLNLALLLGLVAFAIVSGGKAMVFLAKLGKLLMVLAVPSWVMLKASFTMMFARFQRPEGRQVTRADAPALFDRLDSMRKRVHGPRIHRVLVRDELNAAIVQYPRFGLIGMEENTLILGLSLLLSLNEAEALAVVAHEYGHLSGHHSRFGGFIYRLRSTWGRLAELSQNWNDWGSRLVARLFRWYAPMFNAYTFAYARQHEYLADRTAVDIAGIENAGHALMRIGIAAQFENEQFWPAMNRSVLHQPAPPDDKSARWSDALHSMLTEAQGRHHFESALARQTDPMDTHPALSDRLTAIGVSPLPEAAAALPPPSPSAAEAWFGAALQSLQEEFDQLWQRQVGERWRSRHDELQGQLTMLNELDAKPTLSPDELWQKICAIDAVAPERDCRPLVETLLASAPDHLPARFRLGTMKLEAGDASGILDLEHVMNADRDAELAGCGAAWRFFCERDVAEADRWSERWQRRSNHLAAVEAELKTLSDDADLQLPELDHDTVQAIRALLAANAKHIRRAWLARRVLKSDPGVGDHVLAFTTSRLTLGNKGAAVLNRLASLDWPVPLFVANVGHGGYKRLGKQIRQLGKAPIYESS